jgi:hypothetical protein
MHIKKFYDSENKSNIISLYIDDEYIKRVVVNDTIDIQLNVEYDEHPTILNSLFTIARSDKASYSGWVKNEDLRLIWTETLPLHIVVTSISYM